MTIRNDDIITLTMTRLEAESIHGALLQDVEFWHVRASSGQNNADVCCTIRDNSDRVARRLKVELAR